MRFISADQIDRALAFPALIEALADAFRGDIVVPHRAHHPIRRPDRAEATLLLMPAWTGAPLGNAETADGHHIGIKIVSVFPDNASLGKPSVTGVYLLLDGASGEPVAVLDGPRLTLWRTAAASALAAKSLARADATHLLALGAGALAPFLVRAHCAVRPIETITLWNRSLARAEAMAAGLADLGIPVTVSRDLEAALGAADIVTSATLSTEPLVKGACLKPGTHVDLVGGFRPDMREADDDTIRSAHLFVDTAAAVAEAGDLVQPLEKGLISVEDLEGDLAALVLGRHPGRSADDQITLFKSVGTALEDLAGALAVVTALNAEAGK